MKDIGTVNMGQFLKASALRYGDKEALVDVDNGTRRSYRELNMRVNSLAHGLLEAGIKKGDFVAVLSRNCAEFVEIYFALAKIGAVIAPQVYRLSPGEISALVDLCDAKAFIFSNEFNETITGIRPDLGNVGVYVGLGDNLPDFAISYEGLATGYSTAEPTIDVFEEDPQYLNYTSGTTDIPKAYILNHYNNVVGLLLQFGAFEVTHKDRVLTVFPLYGRVAFAWAALSVLQGATNVVLNFSPDKCLEIIEKEKITLVNLVPIMTQLLMISTNMEDYDLSSLRCIVYAGSSLPQAVYEETRKRMCPQVFEYYGLQETAIITMNTPDEKLKKPTSVGVPPAGINVRIVDEENRDVPPGETGEVIMRGPGATTGYYKQPEKTSTVIVDGWFHTGDLGRFDEDGYLYIVGRKKDMIVSGAQNVFAPEVEEAVLAHPAVAGCAVIGLPHELWGEQVTAVVVLKEGAAVTGEEIMEFCKERIAHFKAPKDIIFSSMIPRNPAGKVMKFMLVNEYKNKEETQ